jgi:hypothetical protein
MALALAPALLWMIIFYQQDRLEPEPVGQVGRVFVIGLALTGALTIPLTDQFFKVWSWLYRDPVTTVLGSLFLLGGAEAFTIYAAVRFFIFDSPEFDERTDGVIYATAAALGCATARNFQFILSSQGAEIGSALVYMIAAALAQAAFGGLLGYFLGRARLEREPVWWLTAGVALTALLNGAFRLLTGRLNPGTVELGQSGGQPSFTALALAGLLAAAVAGVVFFLIRRDIDRTLAGAQPPPAADRETGDRQANWLVLSLAGLFLLTSFLIRFNAVGRYQAVDGLGFKGSLPVNFIPSTREEGRMLRFSDRLDRRTQITLAERRLAQGYASGATAVASLLAGERSTDYDVYRVLDQSQATLAGRPAMVQRFAYVSAGLSSAVPRVVEGVDYIVVDGGRAIVVTLVAAPNALPNVEPTFERFLKSLSF